MHHVNDVRHEFCGFVLIMNRSSVRREHDSPPSLAGRQAERVVLAIQKIILIKRTRIIEAFAPNQL